MQPQKELAEVTAELAAATIVGISLEHVQGTHDMVFNKLAASLPSSAFAEENWPLVLSESLVFHACLMILRAQEVLSDADLSCSYWVRVDRKLQSFTERESGKLSEHVREVFRDSDFVNDALDCYVRGTPTKVDQKRLDACSSLLGRAGENRLHFIATILHTRIAAALGISVDEVGFVSLFITQASSVKAMWETVIRKLNPIL